MLGTSSGQAAPQHVTGEHMSWNTDGAGNIVRNATCITSVAHIRRGTRRVHISTFQNLLPTLPLQKAMQRVRIQRVMTLELLELSTPGHNHLVTGTRDNSTYSHGDADVSYLVREVK
jgi:hypothetical protein